MSTKKLQIIGSLGTKVYTQNEEPADAIDGALWLDLDEESTGGSSNAVGLPTITDADEGKFLRVVGGAWTATAIDRAEEASF